MVEINWLHLSDLHHRFENFKTEIVRDSLIKRIEELKKDIGRFDFLAVTGDLAYKGVIAENTMEYIRAVMAAAAIGNEDVFIVPGNHEIKREEKSSRDTLLDDLLYRQPNPSNYITGKTDFFKASLLKDQQNFFNFYRSLCGRTSIRAAEEKLHYVEERENFNILSINTSWLCRESSEDSGRLVIGKNMLYQAVKNLNRNKPTIALGHHTLSTLDINEQNEILNMFHNYNVDIYLCGHVHEPYFKREAADGDLYIVTSSAFINDGYAVPGFTTGKLNISTGQGEIRYFRFNTRNNEAFGHWSLDYSIDSEVGQLGYKPLIIRRFQNKAETQKQRGLLDTGNTGIAVTKNLMDENQINQCVIDKYMPRFIDRKNLKNERDFSSYSKLFSLIIKSPDTDEEDIFAYMTNRILYSSQTVPFHIRGGPGTGKTTLLCALYFYMMHMHSENPESPLPIYIDVGSVFPGEIDEECENDMILEAFKRDTEAIIEFMDNYPKGIVLIIDGIDDFISVKKSIHQYIHDKLYTNIKGAATVKKIIGISMEKSTSEEFNYGHFRPQNTIALNQLRTDDANADLFIELFDKTYSQCHPKSTIRPNTATIKNKMRQWKIKYIDLFIMNLLYNSFEVSQSDSSCDTLVEAYKQYCKDYLTEEGADVTSLEKNIDSLAALAYECGVNCSSRDISVKSLAGVFGWKVIYKHSTIRDYLAARFIANNIKSFAHDNQTDTMIFEYIYPHPINKFFKGIINENNHTQQVLLKAIYKLSKGDSTGLRSTAVFIAGRLTSGDCKRQARQYLEELKKTIVIDADSLKDMERLFYYRCIYVSLICLGDRTALEEYINCLLKYREWNEVNRGFHLEYYGDIDYVLKNKSDHKDSLEPFNNTYDRLRTSILNNLKNDRYLLWNLELFTLCSLVQNRNYNMARCGFSKEELETVLCKTVDRQIIPEMLKGYIQMFKRDLEKQQFDTGYLIDQFYTLKDLKRRGWTKRGLINTESVADHTYGAYLLAMAYLPETKAEIDYDKGRILQMLLVHDLAEVYIGDLTPDEKTVKKREEEKRAFQLLSLSSTYESIYCLDRSYELWQEFEEDKSANARIAKEIDRLDGLVQLYQYKLKGRNIPDFEKWREEIESSINTDYGENILNIIKLHFRNLEKCRASDAEEEKNVLIHPFCCKGGKRPRPGDMIKISKDVLQGICTEKIKYLALVDTESKTLQYIAEGILKRFEKNCTCSYMYQCTRIKEISEMLEEEGTKSLQAPALPQQVFMPIHSPSTPFSNYYGTLFSLKDIKMIHGYDAAGSM